MKRRNISTPAAATTCVKLSLILFALVIASVAVCTGQNLTVTIQAQAQPASPGDVVTFQGTIRNDSAETLYLNGDRISWSWSGFPVLPVSFDLHCDEEPFVKGAPVKLDPAEEWSGDLFRVTVGIDAPGLTFDGSLAVMGGTNPAPFAAIGTGTFQLSVLGVPPAAPPAAPENLAATVDAASNATLTWTGVAGNVDGYIVERSSDGVNYTVLAQLGAGREHYVVTNTLPTDAFFRVQAFNSFNTLTTYSPYSTISRNLPANLVAVGDDQEITLTWNPPFGPGTDSATYNVYRGTSPGGQSPTPIVTGLTGPTHIDVTGLTNQQTYYYFVTAVFSTIESTGSNEASAVPHQTFSSFQQQYFTAPELADPNISGPLAIPPGGNGLVNLIAYGFNESPWSGFGAGTLPTVSIAGGYLEITFIRRRGVTDVIYVAEVAPGLGAGAVWQSGPAFTTELPATPIDVNLEWATIRDNVPISPANPRRFIRIAVELQP